MTQTAPEHHRARTTLEVATAARVAQLAIRARLMRDVTKLWPLLDAKRLDATWPAWSHAMGLLVRNYRGQSSQAAALAYRESRQIATQSPAPRSLIKFAPEPSQEWLDRAFGYSGPGMLNRDTARPNTALSTTLGTASRIALDGGHATIENTIAADPVALGYYRVTDGDPCAFCAMLAGRGAVYKAQSFRKSNAKFEGEGQFKVHNHCGCDIAPIFERDQKLPEANERWQKEWQDVVDGLSGADARLAWRQHFEGRDVTVKPGDSKAKGRSGSSTKTPTHDPTRDVDAGKTVEQLQNTLAQLEKSLAKFDSPGTRKRVEELRRKIAERS